MDVVLYALHERSVLAVGSAKHDITFNEYVYAYYGKECQRNHYESTFKTQFPTLKVQRARERNALHHLGSRGYGVGQRVGYLGLNNACDGRCAICNRGYDMGCSIEYL